MDGCYKGGKFAYKSIKLDTFCLDSQNGNIEYFLKIINSTLKGRWIVFRS